MPGAINIPVDSINAAGRKIRTKDTPVYSYCLRGSRSAMTVPALKAMGYTNVTNIGGTLKEPDIYVNRYELDTEGLRIKTLYRDAEWYEYLYGNRRSMHKSFRCIERIKRVNQGTA